MEDNENVKKILIIDNDNSYTGPLRNALSKKGYDVVCWDDGQKAIEQAKTIEADLLIAEVELPEYNGHTLYKALRARSDSKSIPFIFLSSQKRVDDRIKCMELGVDDYITKPFYVEEVVARVQALFLEISQQNEEQSKTEKGFSGNLTEMNLVDLIQTLELGKKSALLKLKHNSTLGVVYVMNGEVVDSSLEDLPPERAVLRMFTWTIGNFSVEIMPVNRERTIQRSNKELMTIGLRRINQWEQIRQELPPLNTIVTKTEVNNYDQLDDEEKEIISGVNEKKMIYEIIEKSRFDDLKALLIINKLYKKGYLQETNDNYFSNADNYLMRFKQNASRSKTTKERVASIISNVLNKSGDENRVEEHLSIERRQLPDRRSYGRRRTDRLPESNHIHLTKTDLLMIRERLS